MEKKEVSVNTVVKSIITGFASYGIIFYVIVVLSLILVGQMTAGTQGLRENGTKIILSTMLAIFCFVLVRFTCRVSTMDVFKKCIMNPESYSRVEKKMTIFYLICIAMAMFTGLSLLNLNLKYERAEIAYYKVFNSQSFSEEYVNMQEQKMNEQYIINKNNIVKSTVIVELGIVLGFLSLINYQRKMMIRYNEYDKAKAFEKTSEKLEEVVQDSQENEKPIVEESQSESVNEETQNQDNN